MAASSGSSSKGTKAGIGCLIFVGLFWSSITLVFDGVVGWSAIRQIRAMSFDTASGVITRSEVVSEPGNHGSNTHSAKINFSYEVAGQKYSGERYRYNQMSSNDGNAARMVARFPVGMRVPVYYSPGNPADSVLIKGLEGTDLFVPMFLTPFNLIMLGIWFAAVGGILRLDKRRVAGGAKVWDDGFRIQVRLSQFMPFMSAVGFLFFASFLGVFPIAFTAGFNPPLVLMVYVWAALIFGTVAMYLWRSMKLATGYADLVIDPTEKTVTLPRTFGRTEEVVVPLKRIQSLEVERIAQKSTKGRTNYSYVPTLIYTDRGNTTVRAELAKWSDADSTNNLAAWLREKLLLPK